MSAISQRAILKFKDPTFSDQLESLLLERGKVKVQGIGIFEVKHLKERKGHNPHTGGEMMIPAQNKISFRPTKKLKDTVQKYGN